MELPIYEPSHAMLQAFAVDFNDDSLKFDETFAAYLKSQELNYDNVSAIFKTLITMEDLTTMHSYAQLKQSNVIVRKKREQFEIRLKQNVISLERVLNEDIDELVIIPMASLLNSPLPQNNILTQMPHHHEHLTPRDPKYRWVGTISKVMGQTIQFSCIYAPIEGYKYTIILRSPRTLFRLIYGALGRLSESSEVRSYLFPTPNEQILSQECDLHGSIRLPLINPSISTNAEQLQAVQHIVSGVNKQSPYILWGPPGTGKTTTIVEAILQLGLNPNNRIIVTANSNSACNTIALKLCQAIEEEKRVKRLRIIRLFSAVSLRKMKKQNKSLHPVLRKYSNFCLSDNMEFNVYVLTLCRVGTVNWNKHRKITHVFIDEAAASTEPEALISIVPFDPPKCQVILAGDYKQLGAVIKSNRASSLGLGQSLMERLILSKPYEVDASGKYDCRLQTHLCRNYRSHPEIVGLYNELYYDNKLIPLAPLTQVNQACNWNILPDPKFPILFQATFGTTTRRPNSTSSYNEIEAKVLCWYVRNLLWNGLGNEVKVEQSDIGIISPYLAQCKLISQLLAKRGHRDVVVGTVESYQGREFPIIIVSLVTSFKCMGFVANPRRLNVALSRAKSLMILIGNPITLSQNPDLKFVIEKCLLKGNLVSKAEDKKKQLDKKPNNVIPPEDKSLPREMGNLSLQ